MTNAPLVRHGVHEFVRAEIEAAGPDDPIVCRHCGLPFYRLTEVTNAR